MKKNIYKFIADITFSYDDNGVQHDAKFAMSADIGRDYFPDAVAAFKTYVRHITHDMIARSIPDLVEKRVEGVLSISYECEQEGYFETDTNAVCVDSERIYYSAVKRNERIIESFTETSNN